MNTYLARNEKCPIHRSYYCTPCHRPGRQKAERQHGKHGRFQVAVEIVPDDFHPNGQREICSPRELGKRKRIVLECQHGLCWACGKPFDYFQDADLHHIQGKGMGSAWRDDSFSNLAVIHRECHNEIHDGKRENQPFQG